MATPLPGSHTLIVENERCLHQLPELPDTVAVLGAGLNLEWMGAEWLREKRVGYWGDMDTWGLVMLARARERQPHVEPMLMTQELFDRVRSTLSVVERLPAGEEPPAQLAADEKIFYRYLSALEKGRVEQEFLQREWVVEVLKGWRGIQSVSSSIC
jgi:hypothetical protein